MIIRLTKHAKFKITQRGIKFSEIENVIKMPHFRETDKIDEKLIHYVGKIKNKFLRVVGMHINKEFLVITAFYDRRLKKR